VIDVFCCVQNCGFLAGVAMKEMTGQELSISFDNFLD
jgi:hypothetical protein